MLAYLPAFALVLGEVSNNYFGFQLNKTLLIHLKYEEIGKFSKRMTRQ